jgi:NTP pyrophosphatase (non-canonical NTP hydrolase)
MSLTFNEVQAVNKDRMAAWANGQEFPLLFNATELAGEVGELLNNIKKRHRHEMGVVGGVVDDENLAEELGDVVICCFILANKLGLNLGEITAKKFNKTSVKNGFPHRINVE